MQFKNVVYFQNKKTVEQHSYSLQTLTSHSHKQNKICYS